MSIHIVSDRLEVSASWFKQGYSYFLSVCQSFTTKGTKWVLCTTAIRGESAITLTTPLKESSSRDFLKLMRDCRRPRVLADLHRLLTSLMIRFTVKRARTAPEEFFIHDLMGKMFATLKKHPIGGKRRKNIIGFAYRLSFIQILLSIKLRPITRFVLIAFITMFTQMEICLPLIARRCFLSLISVTTAASRLDASFLNDMIKIKSIILDFASCPLALWSAGTLGLPSQLGIGYVK